MVNPLKKFTIDNVTRNLNEINCKISLYHQKPFPNLSPLSHYEFKKRCIKILPNGDVEGGYAKMVTSLIDFSFIRSLVSHCYSVKGPPCYDPPSIFLTDLFGVNEELEKQRICIQTVRTNVLNVDPDDGSMTISCQKLPKDTDARIGVRRDPKNPDKKEKILGYNLVLSTSVELQLKLELPVAVTNIAGCNTKKWEYLKRVSGQTKSWTRRCHMCNMQGHGLAVKNSGALCYGS